jgi:hypothetical protein
MNKQIQSLFDAIYEANEEALNTKYENYEGKLVNDYSEIHLEHLLITAAARGKLLTISEDGEVYDSFINSSVCILDLTKSVSEQEEEKLLKIAEIIL